MLRHKGKIIKGKIYFTRPNVWKAVLKKYEGKRIVIDIEEEKRDVTANQWAFYLGVILKQTLEYNAFGGWTEDELHNFLLANCGGYKKAIIDKETGKVKQLVHVPIDEDIIRNNRGVMARFIDSVLTFLQQEEGIRFADPSEYKTQKHARYKEVK